MSTPDSWEWAIDGALASSIIMNADPSVGLAYRPAGLPLPVQRPSRPRQRALWPILARLGLITLDTCRASFWPRDSYLMREGLRSLLDAMCGRMRSP